MQESDLQDLEAARCLAMTSRDVAALERLFSERLIWTHSSGKTDSKQDLLAKIRSGASQYLSMHREQEQYLFAGDSAIVCGVVSMDVRLSGVDRSLRSRYLNVWCREGDGWRMVAWQSTAAPALAGS